jgi:hypothetical protein
MGALFLRRWAPTQVSSTELGNKRLRVSYDSPSILLEYASLHSKLTFLLLSFLSPLIK